MLKLYKNDLIHLNMFFRGETLDHYIFNVMLNPFQPWDWTVFRWFFTGECGSLLETLYTGYKLPLFR